MNTTLTDVIWRPSGEYLNCRVTDYMKSQGITDWKELVKRSTQDTDWFWNTALEYSGIRWTKPFSKLMDDSKGFAWTKWFIDGEMNIIDNCLDYHLDKEPALANRPKVGADHRAIIWESEDGEQQIWTYGKLNEMTCKVASALTKLGVKAGDSVGIYMPMVPEVVAILFGCLKIGAVAVPVFSGFGGLALQTRMADAEAKVLFTADGGKRRNKMLPVKPDADEAVEGLPDLRHVIVLDRYGMATNWKEGRDLRWSEVIDKASAEAPTVSLPAEHPSMYLYTSGTTGKPKGTVHTHAGAMASIARELGFAFDVKKDDVFFWFTDIGWMMGPWEMIGVTYWGGTMVIAEGAPNFPNPDRVWQMVERHQVNTLGISPTAIRVLRSTGDEWVDKYDMKSLRLLGSTGEPWDLDSYMWFFNKVGKTKCPIINISGGTELIGCLIQPLPIMPIKPCTLGGPGLGMDVDVVDEEGNSIRNGIGHLICRKPSPSMTKGFLKDPDRYIDTYFSKYPNIWYHGDWAKVDEDGFWFLFGRSDDTIKIAGKRLGPGEVESVLVEHPKVSEAAAIGVPHAVKGEGLVCFVVTMPGITPDKTMETELRDLIGHKLGHPMKPEAVHFTAALPKTRSGKIVRSTIRRKYLGEDPGDLSSVENKEALELIPSSSAAGRQG
ncbi:MAG: AMP-binding protein [Candidatus Obscuribacterales bacterium]|nr:AMP-binding protein [Candidatus Obscuribacterales bacterium]